MPQMFGPENHRRLMIPNDSGTGFESKVGNALRVSATTLGDAIKAYEKEFQISIEAYDGSLAEVPIEHGDPPRYFFYKAKNGTQLVDIHIERDGDTICPKQNLLFTLIGDDILEVGPLVC